MKKLIIKKSYIYMISYIILIFIGIFVGVFLFLASLKNFPSNFMLGLIILLLSLFFFIFGIAIIIGGVIWLILLPNEIMIFDDKGISWFFLRDKASINYEDISKISFYNGGLLIGGFTYQIWDKYQNKHTLRLACGNPFKCDMEIQELLNQKGIKLISDWRIK